MTRLAQRSFNERLADRRAFEDDSPSLPGRCIVKTRTWPLSLTTGGPPPARRRLSLAGSVARTVCQLRQLFLLVLLHPGWLFRRDHRGMLNRMFCRLLREWSAKA